MFYVSTIKDDVDGSCSIQEQYILGHHVEMKLNKIPQLYMHCKVRDGGMISQGIGRGVNLTPEPIGRRANQSPEPIGMGVNQTPEPIR